ncbi:hypothetical protein KC338_g118 [Hortaea werneckii]|nr:hypothetical protein KC338_g118 [Hortaea werneckii]
MCHVLWSESRHIPFLIEKPRMHAARDYKTCRLTFSRVARSFGGKVSSSSLVQLSMSLMESDCVYGCRSSRLLRAGVWKLP